MILRWIVAWVCWLFVSAAVVVVGQRVLGGNLLELSVFFFCFCFFLLFSLLCIAFLALRMRGELSVLGSLRNLILIKRIVHIYVFAGKFNCRSTLPLCELCIVIPAFEFLVPSRC